jgi:rubrerythrin
MAEATAVTIWIVDPQKAEAARCQEALRAEGWRVKIVASTSRVKGRADAIVLVNDLAAVDGIREHPSLRSVPIILAVSLDRSGWDRTFHDETAFRVDALLDLPVDGAALVRRLRGILDAARPAKQPVPSGEILRRAIANEEEAERFYQKMASASTDPATRMVLEDLAREEGTHRRALLEFLEGKRPFVSAPVAPSSVVETFGTPELTPDLSPADAFLLAARKEKLAADFYENWAELYPPGPEQDLLRNLADMERRHKAHVEELFINASFPEDFHE